MTQPYRITQFGMVERVDDGVVFPMAEENRDYRRYLTWVNEGNTPDPYEPPPPPVPETISDRQFYQLLALNGTISEAEALAAVATGTIPAALDAYVETLPTDAEKFNARMLLSGAVSFNRHHPLTEAVGAAQGLSSEQLDQFWIAASNI